jgi:hypothetical protein
LSPGSFSRLVAGPCPPFDEVMLALSAELGPVDRASALGALDEHARSLFGIAQLSPARRVDRVAALLGGFHAATSCEDPRGFLLEHVLSRRRGHPALLAVVVHELVRRAGVETGIFTSPGSWYVGCADGDRLALVAICGPAGDTVPPGVRRHCAHEVAFAVLCGLAQSLAARGEDEAAAHMQALRARLPIARAGHSD